MSSLAVQSDDGVRTGTIKVDASQSPKAIDVTNIPSNPEKPVQAYEKVTGKQVNMISQSWDGKRVYVTSSLLANWDKKGADDEQFLRAFKWDGKELTQAFEVDFLQQKLGRAHHMKLGSRALKLAFESR